MYLLQTGVRTFVTIPSNSPNNITLTWKVYHADGSETDLLGSVGPGGQAGTNTLWQAHLQVGDTPILGPWRLVGFDLTNNIFCSVEGQVVSYNPASGGSGSDPLANPLNTYSTPGTVGNRLVHNLDVAVSGIVYLLTGGHAPIP